MEENKKSEHSIIAIKLDEDPFYICQYSYTTFEEMKDKGEYNFYAIIFDASFPKEAEVHPPSPGQKEPLIKYSVELKLFDRGTNLLIQRNNLSKNFIKLIIQVNEKENIPFIHQIGDIIRVQKGTYLLKKGEVYLNLIKNVQYKGSWYIFSANPDKDGDMPYLSYNKK